MPAAPCSRLEELHTSLVDAVDGVVPLFLVLGDVVVEENGADNVTGRFWGPGAPRNGVIRCSADSDRADPYRELGSVEVY